MKLVKGDILEFEGSTIHSAKKGAKAVFKEYIKGYSGEEYIKVEWIRDELSGSQVDGNYYESQFKKVEKKEVMNIDFKEGVQRVIDMLEQFQFDFKTAMGNDIKIIINRGGKNAIDEVEETIDSIKTIQNYTEKAIERLGKADSLKDILLAVRNTVFEEDEAPVLKAFLGVDSVTID